MTADRGMLTLVNMTTDDEETLSGGFSTIVTRRGNTVRRTASLSTPTIHALLRHLHASGFHQAPTPVGIDDRGREVLNYIEGTTAWWPWPQALRTDEGLRAVTALLNDLSAALANFTPPEDAVWHGHPHEHHDPLDGPAEGNGHALVVRHGDLGPWNTLWRYGELVALIDWDTAEPAPPGWDTAQAGWAFIPLRPMTGYRAVNPTLSSEEVQHRLVLWCQETAVTPRRLFELIKDVMTYERERLVRLGEAGVEPYVSFLQRGDVEEFHLEQGWRRANAERLIAAADAEIAG